MALSPLAFDLAGIPDIQCPLRAVIEVLDFVEAVTNTPFENLVIQDVEDPETAFPFRAFLEFVEASCEHQLQGLVILDGEELQNYKARLVQQVQESYSKHYGNIIQQRSSPHLHQRIGELQAELSQVYTNLKEQQTELASLRSAHSKQMFKAYNSPIGVDTESDSDLRFIPKRRRLSRRSNHFGTDGVDEQTTDDPRREPKPASSRPHDVFSSPYHTSRQRVSAPYSPRQHHSARSSPHRGRTSYHGAIETMSARGSTLAEYEYDSRAAVGTPYHSAFDENLMPSPSQPQTYAPALAMRKPKVDEYDPLGRLIAKEVYPLSNEKEDAAVTGTWTTIDPDDNRRHWDVLKQQERSQSNPYGSPSMSQKSDVSSHTDLWDRRNSSSGADSAKAIKDRGWAISHDEAEMSVDPRFEDPELDVDPEVRSRFRDVTELLKPQNAPRSAFESRNKDALSRNTAGAVKVLIGGQVAKTLLRKVDNRGDLRDRHGKYIDGQNRGLMKKHLEEDRRRLIKERDEQLVRATQEKRAWDAMDPSEKERRLAKKARNNFLIRMLGAGMGGTDMYETEEIPEVYTRKVSLRETAVWTARSIPLQLWSPAELDNYSQPVQDHEVLFPISSSTPSIQPRQSDRSSRTAQPATNLASSYIAGNMTGSVISTAASLTTKETNSSVHDKGPDLAPLQDITVNLVKHSDDSAAKRFDLTRDASSKHGRVVSVIIHEPVFYSTSAVVERVFGGTVQEIQFFPEERQALVVFVHPDEAATFVKHVQSVKETESRDYRQLQLDATWYKGVEPAAIWPAQTLILAAVIAGEASRSILLRGLSPELSLDELSRQMKVRLSKILVKVTLVKQRNAFTQKREGNSAVLEFASIRDAVDIRQLFESKKVADFTQVTAEVLTDPCCKGPAITREYCRCIYCYRSKGFYMIALEQDIR